MGTLRLLLAVAVVLTHLQLQRAYMIDAGDAVKIFFMISGFYMAMILTEKYGPTKAGLKKFATNRFLRLYPTYIILVGLTMAWYALGMAMTHGQLAQPPMIKFLHVLPAWQAVLFWLPNFTMFGTDIPALFHWSQSTGYFFLSDFSLDRSSPITWMGYNLWVDQSWSIGAEIWFYLVSPLIVFGSIMRPIGVAVVSTVLAVVLTQWAQLQTYYFWPAQIVYFAVGILAYKCYAHFKIAERIPKSVNVRRAMIMSPFVWVLFLPGFGFALPEFVLFVVAAVSIPILFAASKDSVLDREVGNLSYGTYLNHMLLFTIFAVLTKRLHHGAELRLPVVLLSSVLFAFVTERFIEEPVEKIRRRIAKG